MSSTTFRRTHAVERYADAILVGHKAIKGNPLYFTMLASVHPYTGDETVFSIEGSRDRNFKILYTDTVLKITKGNMFPDIVYIDGALIQDDPENPYISGGTPYEVITEFTHNNNGVRSVNHRKYIIAEIKDK